MDRRRFVLVSLAGALAAPPGAVAQPARVARVGILGSAAAVTFADGVKAFRESLSTFGWVEGQNLAVEARYPA